MTYEFPRVQVIPGNDRASFLVDGVERAGYEFGLRGTRPFVFPLIGSRGKYLTRIGHPNPVGHEHHKSLWFGHQSVNGVNFWEDKPATDVRIRHRRVTLYQDGSDWAGLLAELDWWANGRTQMRQRLILVLEPKGDQWYALDLQTRFETIHGSTVELGKTNFGFLGVRVAKTMSEQFGGGSLTSSESSQGESEIFGKRARWVDYSGPTGRDHIEGISYFDHPSNPGHPTHWHVRRDGWMEAAFNLASSHMIPPDHPLDLRYRLWVHEGPGHQEPIDHAWADYADLPAYRFVAGSGSTLASLQR